MTGDTETPQAQGGAPKRTDTVFTLAFAWFVILFSWWAFRFSMGLPGAVSAFETGLSTAAASDLMPLIRWHVIGAAFAFFAVMLAMTCIAEFSRRSRRLPSLAIALNAVVVAALAFDAAGSNALVGVEGADLQPARKLVLLLAGSTIACAWIGYFAVSKRVKEVFVR